MLTMRLFVVAAQCCVSTFNIERALVSAFPKYCEYQCQNWTSLKIVTSATRHLPVLATSHQWRSYGH